MQINPNEMRLIQDAQLTLPSTCGFQLPKIHNDVPYKAVIKKAGEEVSDFAGCLIEAGVISAGSLPKFVATPVQVIRSGLATWFTKRTAGLKVFHFRVEIFDPDSAESRDLCSSGERTLSGKYVLAFEGYEDGPVRMLKESAHRIEAKAKFLFRYAFQQLERASWQTMSIRTPMETLYEAAGQLWDSDPSNIPEDAEAREMLIDRGYDENGDDIETYMPDAILPVFGEGYCIPLRNTGRFGRGETSSRKVLRQLTKSNDGEVASVAKATLGLQRAVARFKKLKFDFPNLSGMEVDAIFPACTVIFEDDSRAFQFIDDQMNYAFQAGCSTSYIGIDELPDTAPELKSYFGNLSAALCVLRRMDTLLNLISTHYEPKN